MKTRPLKLEKHPEWREKFYKNLEDLAPYSYKVLRDDEVEMEIVVESPKKDLKDGLEVVVYGQNESMKDSIVFTNLSYERIKRLSQAFQNLEKFADGYFKDLGFEEEDLRKVKRIANAYLDVKPGKEKVEKIDKIKKAARSIQSYGDVFYSSH